MSTFAFGTQRVSDENALHIEALKEAIEAGLRLIDTAHYYTQGGAQRAIARVMGLFEEEIRSEIKIVSKYQLDETLKNTLELSLKNLQLNCIDCYLLEVPADKDNNAELYEKIYDAFVGLEEAVLDKDINSYGLATENFALDYEKVFDLAKKAATKVGNKNSSFSTIELPINLIEQEGLKVARWAKKKGLRVLANRPLNAQKDGLMYRLAEYDEPQAYYHTFNELLEICDNEQLRALYNLIEQMDMNKHKFAFVGEYDSFLYTQILPHIKKTIEKIPTEVLDVFLEYIDRFLREYREMVAYEASKMTKTALKEYFNECEGKMQECALCFLVKIDDIESIIVGMRKPSYVQEIMALKC